MPATVMEWALVGDVLLCIMGNAASTTDWELRSPGKGLALTPLAPQLWTRTILVRMPMMTFC